MVERQAKDLEVLVRGPVQIQIFLFKCDNVNVQRHKLCLFSFNNLIQNFLAFCLSVKLFLHLLQGNDAGETLSFHARDLTLPKHNSIHRELEVYTELMHWCKAMDRKAYTALTKVYTNSLNKLYERDIKQFFEEAKQQISGLREKKGKQNMIFNFVVLSILILHYNMLY